MGIPLLPGKLIFLRNNLKIKSCAIKMTPDFISILEMGSERAVANIAVMAVEDDPGSFRALLDLCFLEKYPLSMRAARVVQLYCEKHPEAIYPFLDEAVEKTIRSQIKGVRHNFLKIYAEFIDLEKLSDPGPLLNTCFEWLLNKRLTPAIRIHSMGVIYKLGMNELELLHELAETISIIIEECEPSLKGYGRKMREKINRVSNPKVSNPLGKLQFP
jgi:hypothetical protein